jgi:hypothetical protein
MEFLEDSWMTRQRKRIGCKNTRAAPLFREFIDLCGIYIHARLVRRTAKSMRTGTRQFLSIVMAIAVALHTGLWAAVAPFAAASAVDPFTVICHSGTSAPAEQAPAHGPLTPAHACDHCNLCSAATPPLVPDTALVVRFEPERALEVLRPVDIARHDDVAAKPNLARGPPAFA